MQTHNASLEGQPHAQLNFTRCVCARHQAKGLVEAVRVYGVEVHAIEGIEEIRAEIQIHSFSTLPALIPGKIVVLVSRVFNIMGCGVALYAYSTQGYYILNVE